MFKSSFWNVKLGNGEHVSVDVSYDTDGGDVSVDVIGDGWVEKRKGVMNVERTAIGHKVMFASVGSLLSEVNGSGRTAKAAAEEYGSKVARAIVDQRRKAAAEPVERTGFRTLVESNSIFGTHSAALGVAVTKFAAGDLGRSFVGTVVDVSDDRKSVWIRRYSDPADVSILYSVRELELATNDDLVGAARYFLSLQYRETQELRKAIGDHAHGTRPDLHPNCPVCTEIAQAQS